MGIEYPPQGGFAYTAILLSRTHTVTPSFIQPPIKIVQNVKRDEVISLWCCSVRVVQTLENEIRLVMNFTCKGRSERPKDRYILFNRINSMHIYSKR